MALTAGGFLIWWIVDGFQLGKMVAQFNQEQALRQQKGLPPLGLEFLPSVDLDEVTREPAWLRDESQKMTSTLAYLVDFGLLAMFGIALASIAQTTSMVEPLFAAVIVILVFLFFNRLLRFSHLPLIHELVYLEFKLRLFYTHNRPGNAFALFFRPIYGPFTAIFSRKARSEVKLYLEASAVFALFFVVIKLMQTLSSSGLSSFSLTGWALGLLKMFLMVYAVTSPVGAVMTKHVLYGTRRWKIFLLGGSTLLMVFLQLISRV